MTNAWMLGASHGVEQREDEARATTEPVRTDGPAEEKPAPGQTGPDWNEFTSDPSNQLTGLANRELAAPLVESRQYRPWWVALADAPHNEIIDNQVASSGYAAKREEEGHQGHGTMQYSNALEPINAIEVPFGADYFTVNDMEVQEGAGMYMTPVSGATSRWGAAVAQAEYNNASREAYMSTLYDAWLNG